MLVRSILLSTGVIAAVTAEATKTMSSNSAAATKLLAKSRQLDDSSSAPSWIADYSIKYSKCHSTVVYDEKNDISKGQVLVEYDMCSSGSCGDSCKGGKYVVDAYDFVGAYKDYHNEQLAADCSAVLDSCDCGDGDDNYGCVSWCYQNAGLNYCINNSYESQFPPENFVGCVAMEALYEYNYQGDYDGWDEYASNYGRWHENAYQYDVDDSTTMYIGPACSSDGQSLNLALFMDQGCTEFAPSGTFEEFHYGHSLPYSAENIVESECISCAYEGGDDDGSNVLSMCGNWYTSSSKCEKNMNLDNPNTDACDYINYVLPNQWKANRKSDNTFASEASSGPGGWIYAVATILALMVVALAAYAYTLYNKATRGTVELAGQGDLS